MTTIQQVRLSFLFTETYATLLRDQPPAAPLQWLGNPPQYAAQFTAMLNARADFCKTWWDAQMTPAENLTALQLHQGYKQLNAAYEQYAAANALLTPPYPILPPNYIHKFWKFYLKDQDLNQLSGVMAWARLVPFRASFGWRVKADWLPGFVRLEGYLYPHGVVVNVMVALKFKGAAGEAAQHWTFEETLAYALAARRNEQYHVTRANATPLDLHLDALGEMALATLRARVLGANAAPGHTPQLFSVATVIQGRGVDAKIAVTNDSDIHQLLHTLCALQNGWQFQKLRALDQATLGLRGTRANGSVLYSLERSRAVWFPDAFQAEPGQGEHRLGCYHRNLTLLMLQTEMLCHAARLFQDRPNPAAPPPVALDDLARSSGARLGLLYGAHGDTFKSSSPRAFIDQNQFKPIVDAVRDRSNEPGLHHVPRP